MKPTRNVSVLILTLNEEKNLPACLASVSWSDDIVVLDSFSSDGTVDIARQHGARVIQRKFDNWSAHQNYAVQHIKFAHDWVLYIDADERVTPELQEEIGGLAQNPGEERVAFYLGRRNYFLGKWIRHAMPPGMILRLFKPDRVRFERLVNPTPVIQGAHGYLKGHLLHYNFSKGISEWLDKHNRYSSLEAVEGLRSIADPNVRLTAVWGLDAASRRKALKAIAYRLPIRPLVKFFYLYVGKMGFMDGRAGFLYCVLQAFYEFMIDIKMMEMKRQAAGQPV